jgi:hypothetical protein
MGPAGPVLVRGVGVVRALWPRCAALHRPAARGRGSARPTGLHHLSKLRFCAFTALVVALSAAQLPAQSRFASSVVTFNQGSGGGNFDTANVLGGPQGGGFNSGALHILTLGVGGSVTLAFDVTITDGPGADLTVFENGFVFGGGTFSEVAFVEVSTDGVAFARFPTRYAGLAGPQAPFGAQPFGTFSGLTGGLPGLANVFTNAIDPFDPVVSGGESFDLAELVLHPLVLAGTVDLAQIHFVRLVDVVAGVDVDSFGVLIQDNGGSSGADIDAVAVIQHTGNQVPTGPSVDLYQDAQGFLHCVISDPNGRQDLDPAGLRMSLDLVELPFFHLRRFFHLISATPQELHLVSLVPVPGAPPTAIPKGVLAVSVRDLAGDFAGDQIALQP